MATDEVRPGALLEARPPRQWAPAPRRFSVSTLAQIEACARRWSLGHADYSDRGLGVGYPPRVSLSVVAGRVAHCALERISDALESAGDFSPDAVVGHLRALGGITNVIDGCGKTELAKLTVNPRVAPRIGALEAGLTQRTGELRLLVQSALSLRPTEPALADTGTPDGSSRARGALGYGYHPEVELIPDNMNWVGYADAIKITPSECEIIDYKTGEPSLEHEDQVRSYALFWARDSILNPTGRLATGLILVYPNGPKQVRVPSLEELDFLEAVLRARADAAINALAVNPPPAGVDPGTCRFCDVKALCEDYWTAAGQRLIGVEPRSGYRSLEAVVVAALTPSTDSLVVRADPYITAGSRAVILHGGRRTWSTGQTIRFLDVFVDEEASDEPVVTFGPQSEAFLVN